MDLPFSIIRAFLEDKDNYGRVTVRALRYWSKSFCIDVADIADNAAQKRLLISRILDKK